MIPKKGLGILKVCRFLMLYMLQYDMLLVIELLPQSRTHFKFGCRSEINLGSIHWISGLILASSRSGE